MRIAIINMTSGGMSGGYRNYLHQVIPRIASNPSVEALLCASPVSLNVQDWFENLNNVKFINCLPFRVFRNNIDRDMKRRLEKFSPDVLFIPVERYLTYNSLPVVNMVQNMEPFVARNNQNQFIEKIKIYSQYFIGKKALQKSDRIIAISKFVSNYLIDKLNIPDEKIGIVYHGIDLLGKVDTQKPILVPDSWAGKFIFTAGSIRPTRGLEDLLYALKSLVKHCRISGLVIGGGVNPRMRAYQNRLKEYVKLNGLNRNVCWAGNLEKREMDWCYQNCKVFVMTSRVESFAIIASEVLMHGCVCIAADNPCLPEVFGNTAIYYPPRDWKTLTKKIKDSLALNEIQRNEISERARKRTEKYSWDICAERTVAELAKAL